jgi:feruloyl esterase
VGAAPEAINYYESVVARSTASTSEQRHAQTQTFLRLYMIPGMAHCRLGPGATFVTSQMRRSLPPVEDAKHDLLQALYEWVERGKAPETLTATHFVDPEAASRKIAFQRPICTYPKRAVYVGGSEALASSFRCQLPAGASK